VEAAVSVDLAVEAGSVTLITGPSGSGKSTVLHLLGGWEPFDRGVILWDGAEVAPAGLAWHEATLIPQRLGLFPELNAIDNVTLAHRVAGGDVDTQPLMAALGLVGLEEAHPDELSHGEQQRIAVARALVGWPGLVLADEPSSSQDEESARRVFAAIRAAAESGAACLIAGHDPIAAEYSDRIVAMRDGRIVAEESVSSE
jgi:putative ABC transport system ATP-binding protein